MKSNPFLRPIPVGDEPFSRFVQRSFAGLQDPSPEDLERAVQSAFPQAIVRRTELAAPHEQFWYVYREGRWVPPRDACWWQEADLPAFDLDAAGFISASNAAADTFIAGREGVLVGRHFTDFALIGRLTRVAAIEDGYRLDGEAEATIEFRSLAGDLTTVECHTDAGPNAGWHVVWRALQAPLSQLVEVSAATRAALRCEPPEDSLFERYAQVLVERMPEPTVEGLELRLRKLYPAATVEEAGGAWICRRDSLPPPPREWWTRQDLPSLAIDQQSLIHRASPALSAALGFELVGRFWQELVATQGPDAIEATVVLFELGQTDTVVLLGAAGDERACYAHVERDGELLVATLAPVAQLQPQAAKSLDEAPPWPA